MRDQAGGVEANVVEDAARRGTDADRSLHAGDVRGQHVATACSTHFADAQCCGQAGDGRMQDAEEIAVVEIQPMQQHTVHQCRVAQR